MERELDFWGWWRAPLNRLSTAERWTSVTFLTLMTALGSVLVGRRAGDPFTVSDATFYLRMAQGRMAEVQQPFASRPLAPLLVRGLAALLHLSLQTGFAVLGLGCLLFLLAVVFSLATETGAPRWTAPALAMIAFWPQLWQGYALPDLPYAALLAGLLLLLRARWYTASALWVLVLVLERESTLLVLLCLLLVVWREFRAWRCGLALAAAGLGSVAVRHLTAGSAGNQEHLPAVLYLAGKVPWNLLRTFGIVPWSNLYPYLCAPPASRMHVGFGSLQELGVCGFAPDMPEWAASALMTTFGLLPLVVLGALLAERSQARRPPGGTGPSWWAALGPMSQFCLVYGGLSFVLAPALGTEHARLFGYGWPLFLVALPALLASPDTSELVRVPSRPGSSRGWLWPLLLVVQALLAPLGLRFLGVPGLGAEGGLWALALVVGWGGSRGFREAVASRR